MIKLEDIRGWNFCDWESFPRNKKGHDGLIKKLKEMVFSVYRLKLVDWNEELRKEASIAEKHGRRLWYYVAHKPDLVINVGTSKKDRIFIEYVNTLGRGRSNFLRDLRGMLALSIAIKKCRGFVLAIRHSDYAECQPTALPKNSPVEIMSLKSLFFALDKQDYDYLVGRQEGKNDAYRVQD